jgi:hypothetical protein
MINVMVTGMLWAHRLDDLNLLLPFSFFQSLAATCVEQAVTPENATGFFVCGEPAIFTCLCHVGPVTCWR